MGDDNGNSPWLSNLIGSMVATSCNTAPRCNADCTNPYCGDGIIDNCIETCDNGADNSDTEVGACQTNCKYARCFNGILEAGEECEAGNQYGCPGIEVCNLSCQCGDMLDPLPPVSSSSSNADSDGSNQSVISQNSDDSSVGGDISTSSSSTSNTVGPPPTSRSSRRSNAGGPSARSSGRSTTSIVSGPVDPNLDLCDRETNANTPFLMCEGPKDKKQLPSKPAYIWKSIQPGNTAPGNSSEIAGLIEIGICGDTQTTKVSGVRQGAPQSLPDAARSDVGYFSIGNGNLPRDAIITGIEVGINRMALGRTEISDRRIELYLADETIQSGNRANPTKWKNGQWESIIYGGPTDTWGLSDLKVKDVYGIKIRTDIRQSISK